MSRRPTSPDLVALNPDLARLAAEGFDVSVEGGYLVVRDVPYVDAMRRVRRGLIISNLDLAGDRTVCPSDHMVWFSGGHPCDALGRGLGKMAHGFRRRDLGGGLVAEYLLCSKPAGGEFRDFHEKITTFVAQVSSHAEALDPTATARTGRIVTSAGARSSFAYVDTASSRNGLGAFNARLMGRSIGIVGLGGTGSYILDLVAKTPVHRIHLFDDDRFEQHNAFRAPSAPSIDDLRERRSKVEHFERIYSKMHLGIVAHEARLGLQNLHVLDHLDFVFLAVDSAASRRVLVEEMERRCLPFIDTGLGMHVAEGGLVATIRVTTSEPGMQDRDRAHPVIPTRGVFEDDPYGSAAQVGDLNCLAATLAVIRWKKLAGFYLDLEREHHSVFQVDGNLIVNEDRLGTPGK